MDLKIENWKLLVLSIFRMIFSILSYTIEKKKFLNSLRIAGIMVILVGLFQILVYLFKKKYMRPNRFSFSFDIIYCITGLIVATKPYLVVDSYPIVISALMILDTTLRLRCSMNSFHLEDAQWKIHLALAIVPLLMGIVLILVSFEEGTLHNLSSFLLILDAIADFYTILYYRGIVKRYSRHGEQILDISNQEATAHEVIDGKDNTV